jgi:hypothetical protein
LDVSDPAQQSPCPSCENERLRAERDELREELFRVTEILGIAAKAVDDAKAAEAGRESDG